MSVYIVAQIDIHDRERYAQYEAGFIDEFVKYDGKLLAVDEAPTVMEGEWSWTRTVLIEFSSTEQANAWYHSDGYQAIVGHRHAAATANIAMLQGFS